MRDTLRHFVAEFIGVFALVFVGSGTILMTRGTESGAPLVTIALAHGLVLAVMVSATMRISGHLNPAVTIGFLVTRRIEPLMAGVYILAQLLGAVLAGYALKALTPGELFDLARGGGQAISLDINGTQAFFLELIGTFFLVFIVFGTVVDHDAPKIGGLAVGFVLSAIIMAIGPLTGGSVNPARSFGPAVASGIFEGQIVFWTGPFVGGMLAAGIYHALFLPREREPGLHGPVRPIEEDEPAPRASEAPAPRGKRHRR
jgi:MIP family channel proteins